MTKREKDERKMRENLLKRKRASGLGRKRVKFSYLSLSLALFIHYLAFVFFFLCFDVWDEIGGY